MVIIFDLDDTLYDESEYVRGGLASVAEYGRCTYGWDESASMRDMMGILANQGRGRVFDSWLRLGGRYSKSAVNACVQVYRRHTPNICLYGEAESLLSNLVGMPVYLVTDGNKLVQARKVDALKLEERLRGIYITHQYGRRNAKPSTYCFELIRKREKCDWSDIVYIGDNPDKDFVALNPLGVTTVRVLTGGHKDIKAKPGYEASHRVPNLSFVPEFISGANI